MNKPLYIYVVYIYHICTCMLDVSISMYINMCCMCMHICTLATCINMCISACATYPEKDSARFVLYEGGWQALGRAFPFMLSGCLACTPMTLRPDLGAISVKERSRAIWEARCIIEPFQSMVSGVRPRNPGANAMLILDLQCPEILSMVSKPPCPGVWCSVCGRLLR